VTELKRLVQHSLRNALEKGEWVDDSSYARWQLSLSSSQEFRKYLRFKRHCRFVRFRSDASDRLVSAILQATKALRESRDIALICLLTSELEGDEGSASRPGRILPPGKTRYPLYRWLGGLQGRSGQVWKISPPPGFDSRTVQPVASCYTDWATRSTPLTDLLKFKEYTLVAIVVSWYPKGTKYKSTYGLSEETGAGNTVNYMTQITSSSCERPWLL
jgi:hypothetical protein